MTSPKEPDPIDSPTEFLPREERVVCLSDGRTLGV